MHGFFSVNDRVGNDIITVHSVNGRNQFGKNWFGTFERTLYDFLSLHIIVDPAQGRRLCVSFYDGVGDILVGSVNGGALGWFFVGGTCNEGLNEVDAEEAKEVDDGGEEGEDGGDVGEGEEVERGGGADLVAPPLEEVVGEGEEKGEEEGVGDVEREGEGVGGFGRGGGAAAELHGGWWWRER